MQVNDALRVAYNAANTVQYDALPDSTWSFPAPSGTIAAGQRLDTLHVIFYPSKIDTTKKLYAARQYSGRAGTNHQRKFRGDLF